MTAPPLAHFLLLVEGITRQQAALRIDPDRILSVSDGLELFRNDPNELIEQNQLLAAAQDQFFEIGECLFSVEPDGNLGQLHEWLRLTCAHEPVPPHAPLFFERRPSPFSDQDVMIAELTIDRRDCLYARDWKAFHQRKVKQYQDDILNFLENAALSYLEPKAAEKALKQETEDDRGQLLYAAARSVFDAPFELYSRFVSDRRLIKDGAATLRNIRKGNGGSCSEKAQVIHFVAEFLEIPANYVLSGPNARGEIPVEALLDILETFEVQYSNAVQAYWNHIAVQVEISGQEVLIDASNGNIPFLWVKGDELTAMLDRRGDERKGVPHRFIVGNDEMFYHRVDRMVAEKLLFALELGWADPHIDLVQVLDDELGLLTMPELWLGVLAYRDEKERAVLHDWYHETWLEPGHIRGVQFTEDPAVDSGPLAEQFRSRYAEAANAASSGKDYIEYLLEEANPGEGYRVEFVIVGRNTDDGEEVTP